MNMLSNPYWMGVVSMVIFLVGAGYLISLAFQLLRYYKQGYRRPWQRLWKDY